jgi:hypothetical protein
MRLEHTADWAGLFGATESTFAKGRREGGGGSASVDAAWEAWTHSKAIAILSVREDKSFRKRIILTRACLIAQMSISARGNPSPSISGESRVELFALRIAACDSISPSMVLFDAISVLRSSARWHTLVEGAIVNGIKVWFAVAPLGNDPPSLFSHES